MLDFNLHICFQVTAHLLEAEKRKLHVLQRELGALRTEDHNHNISDIKVTDLKLPKTKQRKTVRHLSRRKEKHFA